MTETVKFRDVNEHKRKEWLKACKTFRDEYDALAFPGGLEGAYDRILNGEADAIEAGICFLECRPYFFQSGYIYKDLMRKIKRAPLADDQKLRYERVSSAYKTYREERRKANTGGPGDD